MRETTKDALELYEANNEDYVKSITILNKLKGIGPATSSLLLSCYDPKKVPFFSDELYRYVHWEEGKSKGWDRKINYTIKEYKTLFERVAELRERLEKDSSEEITSIDIEKVAYVLGKKAVASSTEFPEHTDDVEDDKTLGSPSPKRQRKATPKSGRKKPTATMRVSRNGVAKA